MEESEPALRLARFTPSVIPSRPFRSSRDCAFHGQIGSRMSLRVQCRSCGRTVGTLLKHQSRLGAPRVVLSEHFLAGKLCINSGKSIGSMQNERKLSTTNQTPISAVPARSTQPKSRPGGSGKPIKKNPRALKTPGAALQVVCPDCRKSFSVTMHGAVARFPTHRKKSASCSSSGRALNVAELRSLNRRLRARDDLRAQAKSEKNDSTIVRAFHQHVITDAERLKMTKLRVSQFDH